MNFDSTVANLPNAKVLVVGDVMLDKYIFGSVSRISPEAPVPVLKTSSETQTLGGASNVAHNISKLNAKCTIVGIAGVDTHRDDMVAMLNELGVAHHLYDSGAKTTTKIRVIGERQQIVRIDYEENTPAEHPILQPLLSKATAEILTHNVVVISDYGKGAISPAVSREIISIANKHNKITVVDPKGSDWTKYRSATIITPNVKELGEVVGKRIDNIDEIVVAEAKIIREKYDIKYLVVTRSEKGITVVTDKEVFHLPTHAQEVFDVSGAGDTVVATLACALGAGSSIIEAVHAANVAAGVVVSKSGTVPISYADLKVADGVGNSSETTVEKLLPILEDARSRGKKIVFTNGCFDILHRGHADYLSKARKLGDILVVGVNSDDSVRRLKGESRPVNNQSDRAFLLASLASVNYVVIFGEDTPLELIKKIRPHFLVKGGDYKPDDVVGREYADKVEIIQFVDGYSTTNTIKRLSID